MRNAIIVPDQRLDVKIPGMRINKTWMVAVMLAAQLGVAGCSVISFFPHKAAEKAADKVLDDILPGNGTHGNDSRDEAAKPSAPDKP